MRENGNRPANSRTGQLLLKGQLNEYARKPKKTFDIHDLSMKIEHARKRPRIELEVPSIKPLDGLSLDGIRAITSKYQDLKKRGPTSVIKPKGVSTNPLISQLQEIVDAERASAEHGIQKIQDYDQSDRDYIGVVRAVEYISDSIKIVILEKDNVRRKLCLGCLWNEWIDLKEGDTVVVSGLESNSALKVGTREVLEWSNKWKKLIESAN
ncbi:hypothetical protein CAS74_002934 [Pichia kudriavzevii]|uniref:Uncharacterized protein n=1 Tax=Pichia kudriavzevii TaxID=4909 RepID=A0A1Z8JMZ5_PICKU|nr:hypothetical protein CAS74_002934 [Pichia kudriavzevii]